MITTKKQYTYFWPKNQEIGKKSTIGDRQLIRQATGYSIDTIRSVLGGRRNNYNIIQMAQELISVREDFQLKQNELSQQYKYSIKDVVKKHKKINKMKPKVIRISLTY